MPDEAADDIPGTWLPALARIAGSGDIAELLGGMAALFNASIAHDAIALSCQFTSEAFENGAASRDLQARGDVIGITAQAVCAAVSERPMPMALDHLAVMGPYREARGWAYGLALSIPYRGVLGATAMLYRRADQGPFGADAVRKASMVKLICGRALDRLLDQQRSQALNKALFGFLNDLPVGLVMLNWDATIVFVNREGYRQALRWAHAPAMPPRNTDARAAFQLPGQVHGALNEFRNRYLAAKGEGEADDGPRTITIHHPEQADMRLSVTASRSLDTPDEPPKYLVRFYGMATRTEADFEPDVEQLKLLAQLTATERNIALLVRQGLSNRDIAARLHREVSTVKDHLTHIFDKLAIRSRVQLARMLS